MSRDCVKVSRQRESFRFCHVAYSLGGTAGESLDIAPPGVGSGREMLRGFALRFEYHRLGHDRLGTGTPYDIFLKLPGRMFKETIFFLPSVPSTKTN
jgi:hypothetical protein